MKYASKLAVACVALGAASAFAQDSGLTGLTGFTVGGSVGGSHWKGGDVNGLATDKSDTGLKVYGGYNFTPNIGLEAGYVNLGRFNGPNGNLKADGLYLDAVGTVPLGYNISALGRVGVFEGRLRSDGTNFSDRDHGTNVKVGLGLQYDVTRNIAVRTEWERYRFDALNTTGNADLYSVGVNYKF